MPLIVSFSLLVAFKEPCLLLYISLIFPLGTFPLLDECFSLEWSFQSQEEQNAVEIGTNYSFRGKMTCSFRIDGCPL